MNICENCQKAYYTTCTFQKYCSLECRDQHRNKARLDAWVKGGKKKKAQHNQRMVHKPQNGQEGI